MSALGDAVTGFVGTLKNVAGDSVTYSRGDLSETFVAIPAQTQYEQESDMGLVRWEAKDFLIAAEDLMLGDMQTEPKRGDRIEFAGLVYEVLGDNGLPAFRYSDAHRTLLRVHTKQVGTA